MLNLILHLALFISGGTIQSTLQSLAQIAMEVERLPTSGASIWSTVKAHMQLFSCARFCTLVVLRAVSWQVVVCSIQPDA